MYLRVSGLLLALVISLSVRAQTAISLPDPHAFPENIAATRDGTLYIGSLGSGGVYRVRPDSKQARIWIKPGTFGTHSVFGVFADEATNTLWLCSNDLSKQGITIGGKDGVSALKGFDLTKGTVKVSVPLPNSSSLCNDITVGPDAAVYVTNSATPEILRLAPAGKQLQVWFSERSLQPATGAGLDGLAFGPDGNLYVDRYSPGDLFRIDVRDGKAIGFTPLTPSRKLELADAIRRYGSDGFLLVEGGGRLSSLTINGQNVSVETLKDGYSTPTGVTVVGDTAWVSEGQLPYVFDPEKRKQQPRLPFQIFAVALPAVRQAQTKEIRP